MNPWGALLAAAGFIMMYIGVKGNAAGVLSAFRPASTSAPTSGGPAPQSKTPSGVPSLLPPGSFIPPSSGSIIPGQ